MVYTKNEVSLALCAYCKKLCCHENYPYLTCEMCANSIHIKCLKNGQVPGGLIGDVFFTLHCAECNDNEETLTREKIPWITVAIVALFHLSKTDSGNKGYFHFSNQICDFVETNYANLLTSSKKTKNWKGTLAGVLSSFNHTLVESGYSALGESGWWKLIHDSPPIVIVNERISTAERKRNKELARLDDPLLQSKKSESSDELLRRCNRKSTAVDMFDRSEVRPSVSAVLGHSLTAACSKVSTTSHSDMFSQAYVAPSETLSSFLFEEDADEIDIEGDEIETQGFDGGFVCDFSLKEEMNDLLELDDINSESESQSINQEPQKTLPQDRGEVINTDLPFTIKTQDFSEEDLSNSSANGWFAQQSESETDEESGNETYVAPTPPPKSLFTILPPEIRNTYPWEVSKDPEEELTDPYADPSKPPVPMSLFEETQLYERLRRAAVSHEMPAPVHRLYRKLCVRSLKRQRNLPLFNIDGGDGVDPPTKRKHAKVSSDVRVLDRFQNFTAPPRIYINQQECPFIVRLCGEFEVSNFYSCYTQRLLKAYIRRDWETIPQWVKLMQEMQTKANRKNPDWELPERWPIDYSYVRPQHIASVNSLCKQYFYPGIDLSETLSYPDFTCVALYKKLVVGFAFMVPDTGFNETYISFLFTRPEWRGAGIATFMLYHLTQISSGKDITLHVSVTNPALLLYQKFGFKIEEFVQDFYHKYFPADSKECKHALYLRMAR